MNRKKRSRSKTAPCGFSWDEQQLAARVDAKDDVVNPPVVLELSIVIDRTLPQQFNCGYCCHLQRRLGIPYALVRMTMPSARQTWEDAYSALLQERDRSKLQQRCDEAEQVIKQRLREVLAQAGGCTAERLALCNALHNVSITRSSLSERGD